MSIPGILQYIHRWLPVQKEKLSIAISIMIGQGLIGAACLLSLTKDHLTKDGESLNHINNMYQLLCSYDLTYYTDVAIDTVTTIFRVYLADFGMDHLASTLKKGGVKDLLAFFPANKRHAKTLDTHFREAGLPQVSDWFAKRQTFLAKENMLRELNERLEAEESNEDVRISPCFELIFDRFMDGHPTDY